MVTLSPTRNKYVRVAEASAACVPESWPKTNAAPTLPAKRAVAMNRLATIIRDSLLSSVHTAWSRIRPAAWASVREVGILNSVTTVKAIEDPAGWALAVQGWTITRCYID